jgi:activator of 2-hydroxyglutaryl-CoA dehydratase
MLDGLDYGEDIAVSGGIAKNIGVVKQLEGMLGKYFVELPADPQLMGAIGAAVFAADQLANPYPCNPKSCSDMKSETDS